MPSAGWTGDEQGRVMIQGTSGRSDPVLATALLVAAAGIVGWLLYGVLAATGGQLVYPLDDTYIALAIAESIAEGGYGINRGEFVSASSSIIYPLLLLPGVGTTLHEWTPLLVNIVVTGISLCTLVRIASLSGLTTTFAGSVVMGVLMLVTTVYFNVFGVIFTGLEHSAHTAATLLILAGLITAVEQDRVPWWLVPAIVAATLLRFEGIVASVAAISVLAVLGQHRKAIAAVVALGGCLAAYAAIMFALGLPLLPNSVTFKSGAAQSLIGLDVGGIIADIKERFIANFPIRAAKALVVLSLLSLLRPMIGALVSWRSFRWRDALIPLFVAVVTIAHVLGGGFALERYDVYALLTGAAGLGYIYRAELVMTIDVLRHPFRRPVAFAVAVGLLLLPLLGLKWAGVHHVNWIRTTPAGAHNIYEQQFQMHRFARDFYRAPVAVNDLGYVAFRNPHYVLDLVGLGSDEVRRARMGGQFDAQWMEGAVRRHGIGVVMIYDDWFPTRPASWKPVARLKLGSRRVTPAFATVTFYGTPMVPESAISNALDLFAVKLPAGVVLERL
jgi:hypothetical protein